MLAVDTAEGLHALRAAHENTTDTGPGWHLVCRPARPAPAIALETTITGAALERDLEVVATGLTELRILERDLDRDVEHYDACYTSTELLSWQLRSAAKEAGTITDLGNDYVKIADDVTADGAGRRLSERPGPTCGRRVASWLDIAKSGGSVGAPG